jgi:hypothetical protein
MKDELENARPLRLILKNGTWRLDYMTLLRISNVVFKPVTYAVENAKPILAVLRRIGGQERLAAAAEELFQRHTGGDAAEETFEPEGQSWTPATTAPRPRASEEEENGEARNNGSRRLRALEVRIGRLESLERRPSQIEKNGERPSKVEKLERHLARLDDIERRVGRLDDLEQRLRRVEAFLQGSGDAAAPAPAGLQIPPTMVSPSGVARPGQGDLPSVASFLAVLRMFAGQDATLEEVPPNSASSFERGAEGWLVSHLRDEHDEVVGAVLADVPAAVHIGASVLMTPRTAVHEQLATGKPSSDVLDTISEMFSLFASVINEHFPDTAVRSTSVEPLDLASHPWIAEPQSLLELREGHGGRLIVLML